MIKAFLVMETQKIISYKPFQEAVAECILVNEEMNLERGKHGTLGCRRSG